MTVTPRRRGFGPASRIWQPFPIVDQPDNGFRSPHSVASFVPLPTDARLDEFEWIRKQHHETPICSIGNLDDLGGTVG